MAEIQALIVTYLARVVLAIIIWFVGKRLIRLIINLTERRMNRLQVDKTLHSFLIPLIRMTSKTLLVITIAATLGIEITTFAAVIGAVSLAIGLAFQGSLSNFAGGVLILLLKPFTVGDYIQVGNFSGTVNEIQVFYTILRTPDNQKVIIPNSDLSNSSAINYSAYKNRRANFKISISYESDVQIAKKAILTVAEKHPLILKEPAPFVAVGEYGDDGLILFVRVWAKNSDYWTMYFGFLEKIKVALDEAQIEIPYRQMDVHFKPDEIRKV